MLKKPTCSCLSKQTIMTKGYLYIAVGEMFRHEAQRSSRSLRRFTTAPICLITDDNSFRSSDFDQIIYVSEIGRSFEVKISGIQLSPFDRTVFLDSDVFVCEPIDQIFEMLDYFEMVTSISQFGLSLSFWNQYDPKYELRLKDVFPEYSTGVIGWRKCESVDRFLAKWLELHRELNIIADMPTFREAFMASPVAMGTLPHEYNFTGIKSMAVATGKVRVIHERLGERWDDLRTHMADFDFMDKFARRINRIEIKRLIIPYVGVIPYYFSPFYIKQKLKRMFGIKMKRKRESYIEKEA